MTLTKAISGTALAGAAAMLFATAPLAAAHAEEAKMHCQGVNACKGQSACKSAHNACKGQNSCKGKGFLEMTKAACDAAKAEKK
ncbi:MAG: hypothetical protein JSS24_06735 [Proteobacteria bacterium]|nr:hypothetical protein [Pseudomonadota bacterium]